jgi:hypothetical protein
MNLPYKHSRLIIDRHTLHGSLEFQIRIQINFYMSAQFYNLKQRSHSKTLNKFWKYA